MGDGVNIAARLEGIAKPGAICLSEDAYRQVKGRLDLEGQRSRPDPAQEHRRAGAGLFAGGRRAGRGEAVPSPTPADPAKTSRPSGAWASRCRFAAAIAALACSWPPPAAGIAARRPSGETRPGRASFHRRAAVHQSLRRSVRRIISPTASPRTSPPNSRASRTVSSSRATPPSPTRARASTPRRSARSLASATCSKARCSAIRTGCASTRSSSTPNLARTFGPTVSMRTWPTSSSCKIKWSRDWRTRWDMRWSRPKRKGALAPPIRTSPTSPCRVGYWCGARLSNPRRNAARLTERRGPCSTARSKLTPKTPTPWPGAPLPTMPTLSTDGAIPEPTMKPRRSGKPIGRSPSRLTISEDIS